MHDFGVDGVFTNYPERVVAAYPQGAGATRWPARVAGR
jgi:hypothetical protein